MARKLPTILSLACSALLLSGCETSDPCALRTAACLDVMLIGAQSPIYYRDLTVTVSRGAAGGALVEPARIPELRATAAAGVQGIVTFRLPQEFNELMDIKPDKVIAEIPSDDDKITKLEQLRGTDPRAVRIVVEGMETGGGETAKVRWDSQVEEETRLKAAKDDGNTDEWLHLLYFRVGQNQYAAAYAELHRAP